VSRIEVEHRIENAFRTLPVVVEKHFRWYDLTGSLCQRADWKYEWKEFAGGDDAFTLSAYGLPEPTIAHASPKRLLFLGVNLVFVLFCIGLFVYRRLRVRKTQRHVA
jgi:hypothetical protein